MFYKGWFVSSSVSRPSLQSFLWIVLYLFFSPSFTNLHLISRLPLFFHRSPSFLYYVPFPQSACVLCLSYKLKDLLQLFVPFTSPRLCLCLSVHHCVSHRPFTFIHPAPCACLCAVYSLTWMFRSCGIIPLRLTLPDSPFFFSISLLGAFSSQRRHALWHDGLNNLWIEEEVSVVGRWRWDVWHPSRGQRAKSVLWCVWRWRNLHSPPGDRWQVTGEGRQGLWVD